MLRLFIFRLSNVECGYQRWDCPSGEPDQGVQQRVAQVTAGSLGLGRAVLMDSFTSTRVCMLAYSVFYKVLYI